MIHSPVFDFFVVGSGGGPDETNLSAYLLKLHGAQWEDGIVALEAGSGQGTLARLLRRDPSVIHSSKARSGPPSRVYSASDIYSFVRCFLVTHAHLDHVNSLVLSAGSLRGPRKRIYGLKQTLQDLELVFSGRIWPNLASWKEEDDAVMLLYSTLSPDGEYKTVFPNISVMAMPLNHGKNTLGQYNSAAFFVRHDLSQREFLFFGDVEPDSLSDKPLTIDIWRVSAPKIPESLSTIFIECSWPSGRKDDLLYGHLTPEHLANELTSLATEVVKYRHTMTQSQVKKRPLRKRQKRNSLTPEDLKNALSGVCVYVIHCKDDMNSNSGLHIRDIIVGQIREIIEKKELGAKVVAAEQGTYILLSQTNISSQMENVWHKIIRYNVLITEREVVRFAVVRFAK
ncbi:cyclic-AMP phosphodiesterase [Pholiota conissans]|uniref:Cyclic-AMP phosphodiesterase n=1 Tax=Pholiota conissans TaxID=109636 RepID=A0A9P5YUG8_9AGAR|nr:cyclic-AMP phosphodiesterase [Pholiota conissans]